MSSNGNTRATGPRSTRHTAGAVVAVACLAAAAACSSSSATGTASSTSSGSSTVSGSGGSTTVSGSGGSTAVSGTGGSTTVSGTGGGTCTDISGFYIPGAAAQCGVPGVSPPTALCVSQTGCQLTVGSDGTLYTGSITGSMVTVSAMVEGNLLTCTGDAAMAGGLVLACNVGTTTVCTVPVVKQTLPSSLSATCCDPAGSTCGTGNRCGLVYATGETAVSTTACMPATGTTTAGSSCTIASDGTDDCAAGLLCAGTVFRKRHDLPAGLHRRRRLRDRERVQERDAGRATNRGVRPDLYPGWHHVLDGHRLQGQRHVHRGGRDRHAAFLHRDGDDARRRSVHAHLQLRGGSDSAWARPAPRSAVRRSPAPRARRARCSPPASASLSGGTACREHRAPSIGKKGNVPCRALGRCRLHAAGPTVPRRRAR